MRAYLLKIITIIGCIFLLSYIFYFTTPPKSWEQASIGQLLAIFLSILTVVTLMIDFAVRYLPHSFILGLGMLMIFVLQALNQITPLIALGIILVSILGVRLFPKIKAKEIKEIPKLGLSKEPKKSTLTKFKRRKN